MVLKVVVMAWKVVMVHHGLLVRAGLCVAVSWLDVRWQVLGWVRARTFCASAVFNLCTGVLHVVGEAPLLTPVH